MSCKAKKTHAIRFGLDGDLQNRKSDLRGVALFHPFHGEEIAILDMLTLKHFRECAFSFLPKYPVPCNSVTTFYNHQFNLNYW